MAEPRNNIYRHWPRAAKLQLVRWREIEGMAQGAIIERAAKQFPDLPGIHSSTWRTWSRCREYAQLRDLVTGEQQRADELTELLHAAGGENALADVSMAAALALAQKAVLNAKDTDSSKEIRQLMQTVRDAKSMADSQLKADCEARIAKLTEAHEAQLEEMRSDNEALQDDIEWLTVEVDRLTELCRKAGLNPSGAKKGELSEAAKKRIHDIYGIG